MIGHPKVGYGSTWQESNIIDGFFCFFGQVALAADS
jgi:hypothetical protein